MSGRITDCLGGDCLDGILGLRDDLGLALKPVARVTRTWSGSRPGEGSPTDFILPVKPSPEIKSLDNNVKAIEIGLVKQGDIEIRQVSKNQFKLISEVDGSSTSRKVEILFSVGDVYYQVIKVTEKLFWWNIQLRRLTDQTPGGA